VASVGQQRQRVREQPADHFDDQERQGDAERQRQRVRLRGVVTVVMVVVIIGGHLSRSPR
jgi:hypothetical protein